MDYTTVYNATYSILDGMLLPALSTAISIIIWKFTEKFYDDLPSLLIKYVRFFLYFLIFWTLLAGGGLIYSNIKAALASVRNTCDVVEGKVEDFKSYTYSDTFRVNRQKYSYKYHSITGGYRLPAKKGGHITDGLQVKLCSINGFRDPVIVRLEVLKKTN